MKRVLITYWQYAKGIRGIAIFSVVLSVSSIILRDILRPLTIRGLVDNLSPNPDISQVWRWVVLFAVISILAQIFFRSKEYVVASFESKHMRNLRNAAFEKMVDHSLRFFSKNHSGSLITRQKRFVNSAEMLFDQLHDNYISMIVQIIGVLVVMAFISIPMALGVVVWVGFYVVTTISTTKKRLKLDRDEAAHESKVTAAFGDVISNIATVKMFGSFRREQKRFYDVTTKHYQVLLKEWRFSNKQSVIQGIFSTIIHIGSMVGIISLWLSHKVSTGDVVLVTMYASQLSGTLWGFGGSIRRYSKLISDANEMVEIMDMEPEIKDYAGAEEHPVLHPKDATIRFDHVDFRYNSSERIFQNFSLTIPAGQKVAIVGSTGAGKTTLVALLNRMYDVQGGNIFIGPYNIKTDITRDGIAALVAGVAQNIELFSRSVGENIAYGDPSASHVEIIAASEDASIHNYIETLPHMYDTLVGEKGVRLSGGQRQRVGIARARLHNAPILVFDEATSSLDNITEKEVQRILETELKENTVIIIAHRLSTIRNCDRIIVLENGTILQDGNHDQLIKDEEGLYYKMLHSHDIAVKEEICEE